MSNTTLKDILPEKLAISLSETENKLLDNVQSGDFADFKAGIYAGEDPWDKRKVIKFISGFKEKTNDINKKVTF